MASRRFLVTGGSQGIGAAIVDAARTAGDEVVFTGRNEELISQVAEATGAFGLRADVSVAADNARTVETARERMGGVDVLVNNAAFGYFAKIGELDVDAMRTMFETNVFGLVYFMGKPDTARAAVQRRISSAEAKALTPRGRLAVRFDSRALTV